MYNIVFRVDGSPNMGMGHIMRSLTLAKEFKKKNCNVIFISKYKEGIEKILEEGFEVKILETEESTNSKGFFYGDLYQMKKELIELEKILNHFPKICLLLVDSYNVTDEYFLELKKHVSKIAYIDDIHKFCKPIDVLINGNIIAHDMGYKKYRDNQLLFLGTKYNLIREEFKDLPKREINDNSKKIMITTGGSDPYNISPKLLNILLNMKETKNLEYHVVVGQGFKNKSELEELSKKYSNVVLRKNVKYMSEIMLECDIALSAGGGTLYELCSCGTPTIAFIVAENQKQLVNKLSDLKYIKSIGWYNSIMENDLNLAFNNLCLDKHERKKMSSRGQSLVDGLGAKRIVKGIIDSLV